MDYLSYYENANAGIHADDYTMYQAADALNAVLGQSKDTLAENLLGSQLAQQSKDQMLEAQGTAEALKSGQWGEAATGTGTLILGRQKAYDLAQGVRDRFNEKYNQGSEEAEGEGTEMTETGATEGTEGVSSGAEAFDVGGLSSEARAGDLAQGGFGDGAGGASLDQGAGASARGANIEMQTQGQTQADIPDETIQRSNFEPSETEMRPMGDSVTRPPATAEGTTAPEAGVGEEALSANPAVTTAGTEVAEGAVEGAELGTSVAAESAVAGAEIGGAVAGGSALEAASAAMLAVPGLDVLGGALLIGGIAAPMIIDAVNKKKEKKKEKKAKAQAEAQQQAAQEAYSQTLASHNAAMQSLTSNHHAAITGGIEQKTAQQGSSGAF
jgi:hypothetical protein